jgi:XTP/dITP diphosphohydrolase
MKNLVQNFKFSQNKLVLATNNNGKVKEISNLLSQYKIEILDASKFPYPEPIESGTSFVENAEIKSSYYALKTGIPSLSDDSGLEVNSLNGNPGVYSADWAGNPRDYYKAMNLVEEELNKKNIKTREPLSIHEKDLLKCNFTCLLSLCLPSGEKINFEGKVFGHLTFPPRGDRGFGYDAIFVAEGMDKTFAEIAPEVKHKISHRADAFNKLKMIFE